MVKTVEAAGSIGQQTRELMGRGLALFNLRTPTPDKGFRFTGFGKPNEVTGYAAVLDNRGYQWFGVSAEGADFWLSTDTDDPEYGGAGFRGSNRLGVNHSEITGPDAVSIINKSFDDFENRIAQGGLTLIPD